MYIHLFCCSLFFFFENRRVYLVGVIVRFFGDGGVDLLDCLFLCWISVEVVYVQLLKFSFYF